MNGRSFEPAPQVTGVRARELVLRTADGVVLAGTRRQPEDGPLPAPAIVLSPPGPAGVSDQSVVSGYAERFAAAGFVTVALDPRGFGYSGGALRHHFDVVDRLRDLQLTISAMEALPEVAAGRIGVFGASAGATVALALAGLDTRVRAFVGVCGGFFNPHFMREIMGNAFDDQRREVQAEMQRFHTTGELASVPVVTEDGRGAFLAGVDPYPTEAFDYYGTGRGASARFENRVTTLSRHSLLNYDYLTPASFMGDRAGLLLAGTDDVYVPLEGTQEAYRLLTGPKELVMVEGAGHTDLYDNAPYVRTVTEAAVAWFREHL